MAKKRFYLNCPFDEKDMCKSLGGRWDNDLRKWYVPADLDTEDFRRWWPNETTDNQATLSIISND